MNRKEHIKALIEEVETVDNYLPDKATVLANVIYDFIFTEIIGPLIAEPEVEPSTEVELSDGERLTWYAGQKALKKQLRDKWL